MGSGQVLPGADPPVKAETVHQSGRTRVTRLFLPGGDGHSQGAAGAVRGTPGAGMR
jgi:hypothetical protein